MKNPESFPVMLTAKDAQALTGFSEPMIYRLLNQNGTGAVRIGRRKFFHRDHFLKWLEQQADPSCNGDADGTV